MTDIVNKATRSRMMSRIRGKNTRIELEIRKRLWAKGFRYRLHDAKLPGKPDIVFPKYNAVIFINGCFWHGHHCPLFKIPKTRTKFWKCKIDATQKNDKKYYRSLAANSWRILTIWECALRGKSRNSIDCLIDRVISWLNGFEKTSQIKGFDNK